MLKPLLCAAALALAAPAFAQGASHAEPAAARHSTSKPTATLRYGPDNLRRGQLRMPAGKGPFPVAVVIHGGCWQAAMEDWTGTAPLADALTKRGIATWNVEYRRMGNKGGGYPGTFDDIAAAIDYLAILARKYPVDLSRVTFVGHSSGAHLALWAASRSKLDSLIAAPVLVTPASLVAIDGPGALAPFIGPDAQLCGAPAIVPFMGGTPDQMPDAYRMASPAEHLPLGVRQLLVLGALGDHLAPYGDAASLAGDMVIKLAPGGADHFNIVTPSTPQGRDVVDFIVRNAFPLAR